MPANQQNNSNFFNFSSGSLFNGAYSTARQNAIAQQTATAGTTQPPPNATAATTTKTFVGLCEALNQAQQDWVKEGKYEVADVYEIVFQPPTMANATMKKPGSVDYGQTPNPTNDTAAQQLDPATDSVQTTSRTFQVTAGTQIVQVIDQVLKNSSYITDQQQFIVDEVTQQVKPQPKPANNQVAWYKINIMAQPLKYDTKRRDFAYKMTYLITPYAINTMQSPWFPKGRFRGLHKSYNYWFTGKNTQILTFEQDYNNLYRLVLSGQNVPLLKSATSNNRDIARWTYVAASAQSSQGAAGTTNEAAANAADYLYSPSDQAKVHLRIVGDPAWMQQGEAAVGVTARNFSFLPFNNDGTINYDSSEIVFDINWNRPADYNFNTGIVDVNANTAGNQPQENLTYTAIRCKSYFNKGRFEQDLEGRLLIEYFDNLNSNPAIKATSAPAPANAGTPASPTTQQQLQSLSFGALGNNISRLGSFLQNPLGGLATTGRVNQPAPNGQSAQPPVGVSAPQPQAVGAAQQPTSTGDVTAQSSLAPGEQIVNSASSNNPSSQAIVKDD
jgi:hypothetical protein